MTPAELQAEMLRDLLEEHSIEGDEPIVEDDDDDDEDDDEDDDDDDVEGGDAGGTSRQSRSEKKSRKGRCSLWHNYMLVVVAFS